MAENNSWKEKKEKTIEEEIAEAEENISNNIGASRDSEFSEFFQPSKVSAPSPLIAQETSEKRETLEQMQPSLPFEEKKEAKKEEFQDYSTAYEKMIKSQDLIAPIDDMRRMGMFLERRDFDRVVEVRPTVNLPSMDGISAERERAEVVKYAERRQDVWEKELTEADRRGDVRKYFRKPTQ